MCSGGFRFPLKPSLKIVCADLPVVAWVIESANFINILDFSILVKLLTFAIVASKSSWIGPVRDLQSLNLNMNRTGKICQ